MSKNHSASRILHPTTKIPAELGVFSVGPLSKSQLERELHPLSSLGDTGTKNDSRKMVPLMLSRLPLLAFNIKNEGESVSVGTKE